MPKGLRWRFGLMAVLVLFAIILSYPSLGRGVPEWFKSVFYGEGMKLGLDLQGGMHLILRVDVEQAVRNSLTLSTNDLKEGLVQKGVTPVLRPSDDPERVVFALPNRDAVPKVKELVSSEFPNLEITHVADEGRFPIIEIGVAEGEKRFIREHAVDQSLEIIRNRIDQFGVAEPVIVRQGKEEVVVQLPGVRDPERALKLIGQTAQLSFKLVDDESGVDVARLVREAVSSGRLPADPDVRSLNEALRGLIPKEDEVLFLREEDKATGAVKKTPILLKGRSLMTGDAVKTAHVMIGGQFNEPYVSLELTGRGAKLFEKITEDNVGRRLAIVLDDVVRSAPVIRERIAGGQAQISGSFTHEEASDLAIVLRAGALPAPVQIIQNVTVGPSLGRDSIHKGLVSGFIGATLVLVFMIVYYRLSGLIADVAMFLNILFLFAVLSLFHATLTLPGIAGIILTIGMGVDSNVLIFERMREEKALGKPVKAYIDSGYDKAFWSIVDAHVTTLITAFALFLFGTGPVKGFAVTLSTGIVINLFTAIFGTRIVYDWLYFKRSLRDISFLSVLQETHIDFMGLRKAAYVVSGILAALGLVAFLQILRGEANLGVDFSGGGMIQYKADRPFSLDKIRTALEGAGISGYTLQDVPGENILLVRVKQKGETVEGMETRVTEAISRAVPEASFVLESKTEIGSTVSKDLRNKALIAIAISLAGIICYLAFRFNLIFGVAAAVATFHDVLAVLGICYLMDIEITLLIVTALLTIAGYSLTDTVVVFDRIRETIRKATKLTFSEIINRSVNEMLARTVITSLTTLFVAVILCTTGGVVIRDFAFAVTMGVLVGTYSSVFVASPIVHALHKGAVPET
ncbi:MAG: protein translocase subunit SecD [Deltaproteobacteria bacterium]